MMMMMMMLAMLQALIHASIHASICSLIQESIHSLRVICVTIRQSYNRGCTEVYLGDYGNLYG